MTRILFFAIVALFGLTEVISTTNITFAYTGSCTAFTVPDSVTQLSVKVFGASGGYSNETKVTYGSVSYGNMKVNPGEVYYFCPGGAGSLGKGGWNGGGNGGYCPSTGLYGYGGGGGSDIRTEVNSLESRLYSAGGGGGAGVAETSYYASGASGGCGFGGSGDAAQSGVANTGGHGAQSYSEGLGGTYTGCNAGMDGTLGKGGDAAEGTSGGGGGGGYYGGGGGSNNGGGGGVTGCANGCGGYSPSNIAGDGFIQVVY